MERFPGAAFFRKTFSSGQAFAAMDTLLDRERSGGSLFACARDRQPDGASILARRGEIAILRITRIRSDGESYIHLLITPHVELPKITHSLKRFTSREANRILSLTGKPFWQDESYDRLVRDTAEFERIRRYVEYNPVRAGLVVTPEAYPWSSAGRRLEIGAQLEKLPH